MTNSDTGGQLAGDILRTIAHEYGWPDFQPAERKEVTVLPETLQQYVGVYDLAQMAPNYKMMITAENGQLTAQASGGGQMQLFASSATKFFPKVVNDEFEFTKDEKAKVISLTLYQHDSGRVTKAPKISDDVSQHKEIAVSLLILAQYVGTYKLQPGVDVTVTLQGPRLFAQLTGQPSFQLFAEAETKFFSKLVDLHVEFLKDEKGAVTHLMLYQGATAIKAPRK
jgi:hypothetical protein